MIALVVLCLIVGVIVAVIRHRAGVSVAGAVELRAYDPEGAKFVRSRGRLRGRGSPL